MAGTVVADTLRADSTSTLVLRNGVASTPPTVQDSAGTEIGTFCRAWVNFNGTGTVAIRASFNVTSITDNGAGDYTVNFTTAMSDTNYSAIGAAGSDTAAYSTGGGSVVSIHKPTIFGTSSYRFMQGSSGNSAGTGSTNDTINVTVAIFR